MRYVCNVAFACKGGQGELPCERPMLIGVVSYAYQDAEVEL